MGWAGELNLRVGETEMLRWRFQLESLNNPGKNRTPSPPHEGEGVRRAVAGLFNGLDWDQVRMCAMRGVTGQLKNAYGLNVVSVLTKGCYGLGDFCGYMGEAE